MYEKLEECLICKSKDISNKYIIKDHSISGETFNVSICNKCQFLFTNPRPTLRNINKYYESEEYISHTNKTVNPIQLIYKIVRFYTMKSKIGLVKSLTKNRRLFDFGCGTGTFLKACKKSGFTISGFEPNKGANQIASLETNSTIFENLSDVPSEERFDVITLWHVLEHVHELNETIKLLFDILKPGGHLIFALPNPNSFDAKHYKEYWAGYDVPRHLYHFSEKNIVQLASNHKLKYIRKVPMKFDSYYVSHLSNKYIQKEKKEFSLINNIKESIALGYKSNRKAAFNSEYSSSIYIFIK